MTARIRDKESHFKAGEKIRLFKGPLLKRLTYEHCRGLEFGERIWLTTKEPEVFIAATVTKVSPRSNGPEINYTAGKHTGHFTVEPNKTARCYRFLDEDVLAPNASEKQPSLRLVAKG